MMKQDILSLDGKKSGSIDLPDSIFAVPVRGDVLARVVRWQLDKRRAGTHSTKVISEISGTTKKPFAQKGTGRARQGSLRSPQMRGGATIFGPRPHSHETALPKKLRALGLKMALSAKASENKIVVVDTLAQDSPKTKLVAAKLAALEIVRPLFVDGAAVDANFKKSIANIPDADVLPAIGANVYDIIRHGALVLTKDGIDALAKRFEV
ncbi:MAG: 50S ribosomal protein L4 [Rickettsiales bacterium]|jgi:large subunit ribosomal protein L4|nr:50S ribosomal protein L4 [Rickettsiales bacterium]